MKVSVIIPVYKDLVALGLILQSLMEQSYKNFEVVIAEDNDAEETKEFIKQYTYLDIVHVSHEDLENRKTVIQNKAILQASGEYLIFIDGDVVPYKNFIENQILIAQEGVVLSGRRVNLNSKISTMLRQGKLKASTIERFYILFAFYFMFDRNVRYEQGFLIDPKGFFYGIFLKNRVRNSEIIGCNFSCFKEDFVAINGFDESYIESRIGDDIDLTWRFKAANYKLKSSKNLANVFHLHHFKKSGGKDVSNERDLMNRQKKNNEYICKNGLIKNH